MDIFNRIKEHKPAIFDWMVFTISVLLGFVFPHLSDLTASGSFSAWMLGGLVLYTSGLCFKHQPVYYRLAKEGKAVTYIPYLFLLIIGHWIIMLAVLIVAESSFRQMLSLAQMPKDSAATGGQILTAIITAAFITWLAFRPGGKRRKNVSEKKIITTELIGDVVLITGVSLLSFVFWEKTILDAMVHMRMNSIGEICLLFIFLSFAYMLFYLPLRYLYFIEDHSKKTWRRLLIIFLLVLVRGLFEALRY